MNRLSLVAACVVGAVAAGSLLAAELKSGPQVGDSIPGPFHPLNVTGPFAGKKQCLV
jgi:hypothetical protein